jgi:hypothetical protein
MCTVYRAHIIFFDFITLTLFLKSTNYSYEFHLYISFSILLLGPLSHPVLRHPFMYVLVISLDCSVQG